MYHRYMPTGNGQFQRSAVPDAPRRNETSPQPGRDTPRTSATSGASAPEAPICDGADRQPQLFLNRLLPGMDSGDLLVVLILLLLLMEGSEDSAELILTLAIFLFLH